MNRSAKTFFITGTDTGCGKTTVAVLMARQWASTGLKVACFKPIASGCEVEDGRLVNDDALQLMRASNAGLAYEQVNPHAFQAPIAPHIA
ncbi:MAG: ATP-dependent dethiobiotin synthetase BioD, partial [Wenzhouxiangellaceae bacterium]|nr:ATP-dependent dethiobiotin synthetase BioD [Wenzhouxiangellaceae bacterium]